ncbi:MAG: DUF1045 domain-containing protein [Yoonia sp.]
MFERYAIFYTPAGPLAAFGAEWLGWDSANGQAVAHPDFGQIDVAAVTQTPRNYGLHGTLKAPFYLAQTTDVTELRNTALAFAARQSAFSIGAVELRRDNGFVALRPTIDTGVLRDFASRVVKTFDPFRAPLTEADIARRRQADLSDRQDQQMLDWGYPFIFDDFHFHLTLSGSLDAETAAQIIAALSPHLDPIVPKPFVVDAITLMGQDSKGMFHQIHRYALTG